MYYSVGRDKKKKGKKERKSKQKGKSRKWFKEEVES